MILSSTSLLEMEIKWNHLRFNLTVEPAIKKWKWEGRKRVIGVPRFLVEHLVYFTWIGKTKTKTKQYVLGEVY